MRIPTTTIQQMLIPTDAIHTERERGNLCRNEANEAEVGFLLGMARTARGEKLEGDLVWTGRDVAEELGRDADGPAQVPIAGDGNGRRAVVVEICG